MKKTEEYDLPDDDGLASRNDRIMEQTVKERDEALEAFQDLYFKVTGQSLEWSNVFGFKEAIEEIMNSRRIEAHSFSLVYDNFNGPQFMALEIVDIGHADKIVHLKCHAFDILLSRLARHPCACDWLDNVIKEL